MALLTVQSGGVDDHKPKVLCVHGIVQGWWMGGTLSPMAERMTKTGHPLQESRRKCSGRGLHLVFIFTKKEEEEVAGKSCLYTHLRMVVVCVAEPHVSIPSRLIHAGLVGGWADGAAQAQGGQFGSLPEDVVVPRKGAMPPVNGEGTTVQCQADTCKCQKKEGLQVSCTRNQK